MAGTGTAPDVSVAAPSAVQSTLHVIDASGDLYTDSITTVTAPTLADLEAWKDTYQGATQASVYKVSKTELWEGDADPDNAETDQRNSAKQGINMLFRNPTTLASITPRLVAPIPGIMQGNQDIPLFSSTELTALVVEYLNMLTGFNIASGQYTERRERSNNPRIKV